MAALRCAAIALALALVASGAAAQARPRAGAEAARLVDEGRRLYRELEFLGAIEVLERALAIPGLTPARRAEALEVLGAALVVLDRDEEARRAFERLFALDPYYEVREPSGSPKIARFVARVRAEVVPDAALDPEAEVELELPRAPRGPALRAAPARLAVGAPRAPLRARRGRDRLRRARGGLRRRLGVLRDAPGAAAAGRAGALRRGPRRAGSRAGARGLAPRAARPAGPPRRGRLDPRGVVALDVHRRRGRARRGARRRARPRRRRWRPLRHAAPGRVQLP
ncbi:MAG: hypothetical protein M5U28_17635 [Sandaracinaceae bacterium]|nr:hypothetical protein [Sandaracinaceae bacterium]